MSNTQTAKNEAPVEAEPPGRAAPAAAPVKKKETKALVDPLLGEVPDDLRGMFDEEDPVGGELPTLGEVGKRLPIGFRDQNGEVHRTFELVEWNWDVEEALGQIAETEPDMPMPAYISEVIGHGLKSLGSITLEKMNRGRRRLLVRNLYFVDAICIYVWIRIEALGYALKLDPFKCGSCRKEIQGYQGDLRTLEVKIHEEIPKARVTLEHGVQYAGKRLTEFHLGPLQWSFMEEDPATLANSAKLRKATLRSGVVGLTGAPEGPVHFSDDHLRTMKPREINRLVSEIDQLGGGLVMELRDRCPHCKEEFAHAIDWSHDAFFAPSSH